MIPRAMTEKMLVAFAGAALFFLAGITQSLAADTPRPINQSDLKGRYFLVVWSYQGPDDDLVHAHTFTSFYRGDDLAKGVVRPATISWLPATGVVHPFGSERGRNFSLRKTLRMACHAHRKVRAWGPYEIRPELYQSAVKRLRLLKSGRVQYSMVNALPRSMNCITAAGDLTPTPLDTGILWGAAASAEVVRHLSPYFVGDGRALEGLVGISKSQACPGHAGQIASDEVKGSITKSVASSLGH
jgi:hypothetical protein